MNIVSFLSEVGEDITQMERKMVNIESRFGVIDFGDMTEPDFWMNLCGSAYMRGMPGKVAGIIDEKLIGDKIDFREHNYSLFEKDFRKVLTEIESGQGYDLLNGAGSFKLLRGSHPELHNTGAGLEKRGISIQNLSANRKNFWDNIGKIGANNTTRVREILTYLGER